MTPSGESPAESPIPLSKSPTLNPVEVVPNFGSIKPPPLHSRKAAGSAEMENVDRDNPAFIAEQFERLKTIYQQFNKSAFIGNEQLPWKSFRKWPFEKRHASVTKLPLYFKGFNATFARWNAAKPNERGEKPKCASLRDYICGELFENIGWPKEPVAPPKPPHPAWCAAIKAARRSQFDDGAFFAADDSDQFATWIAAERKAGVTPLGAMQFRRRDPNDENKIAWSGRGRFFVSEWPPAESDFTEEDQQRKGAA